MAQRTMIELVDDLDGSEADQTVYFGVDGVTYAIDLNDTNAAALRATFAPWREAGRKARPVHGRGRQRRASL